MEESFSGRVGQIKAEVPQSGHEMPSMRYPYYPEQASVRSGSYGQTQSQSHSRPAARYGESGAETNYPSGVIKSYSHGGAPSPLQQQQQQRPTMPHHDLNASMIAAQQQQQQQQSASVISLKQQQTDLLRTDLQRIQSPNQAASVGFMQMATPQMYPPTQSSNWTPPRPSNMVQGVNSSGAGFSQPLLSKSSPSPTFAPNHRISASPTMMRPNVGSPAAQHPRPTGTEIDPSLAYYKSRQGVQQPGPHMLPEKYGSAGDLSRPATSIQPVVRHSSAERYTKAYGREMHTIQVKQEPQRGSLESYNRQSEYGNNLPSKLEPRPPNVVPRAQIQMPQNNYNPKFQQVVVPAQPGPSSSRGPSVPTDLMKAPAEVVNHSVQVVQSASTSSVLPGGPRIKRESPLDLSVKTVKTKADSTGGYYDGALVGSSVGGSGGHVKPTSSLKVNYVPNFGQHQRQVAPNHSPHEPGLSRQNHTPIIAAPLPPHQQPRTASATSPGVVANNSGYGPRELIYQSTYSERSHAAPMIQTNFSGPESVARQPLPGGYPPNPHQQYPVSMPPHSQNIPVASAEGNQRRSASSHNQPQYPAPPIGHVGAPNSRYAEQLPHYKVVPPGGASQIPLKQPVPQPPLQTHHNMQSSQFRQDQAISVERKRHADFAHLSAAQQPPAKAIKVNDPYHQQSIALPQGHYESYASKELPSTAFVPSHPNQGARGPPYHHQYAGHEMPPRSDTKYEQPPMSYPNAQYHQPPIAVKKEQHMPVESPNYPPRSDLGTLDQKSSIPVYRPPLVNRGPGYFNSAPPQELHGSYPGDVKHHYPPAPNVAGHHSKMGPVPHHVAYPVSQVYYHTPGEPPSMPQASLMTPSHESLQYPKPEPPHLEYHQHGTQHGYPASTVPLQPPPHLLSQPPQFVENRPLLVVPPPKGSGGVDRSVISKLKNAIEEKQHRLIQKQTSIEGTPSEDNKGDIASILAARIRTKGELKGYTGPSQTNAEPKVEFEAAAPLSINPKERFDPPADMEGVPSFDLMDWGSACNDFVEQLQTGKKKTKRRKLTKPGDMKQLREVKLETSLPMVDGGLVDVLPLESLVPREAIEAAASLGRKPDQVEKTVVVAQSEGSSDEDKPLVLIRQLSLEKAKVTESDANSRCSSLLLSGKTNERAGVTMKGLKVKRLLQEKRYADRIANATSSDSDTEKMKPQKPFKRKKNYVKQAKVNAVRKLIAARTGNSSKEESDAEDEKGRLVLPKKGKPRTEKIPPTTESLKRKSVNRISNSSSSEDDPVKPVLTAKPAPEVAASKLKRKSKNAMAAKSLSDAENKAGCSKQSPTPTRTTKMRRTLSKDVGPPNTPKNGKDQKKKSKREEHMTRSKKKQEMVANSLVLRNDKVVRNVAKATRNKPGPKPKVPVVTSSSSSEEEEEEDDEEEDESAGSSSSESDAETIISDRWVD